jgi:hypothetical protein
LRIPRFLRKYNYIIYVFNNNVYYVITRRYAEFFYEYT